MRILLCFILIHVCSSDLFAQNWKGKVICVENSLVLFDVKILDGFQKLITSTDQNGLFKLSHPGTYIFNKNGYYSKTVVIENSDFYIIELSEKPMNLGEVLIKANNFQSELRKISSSISMISTKQLKSNNSINIAPVLNAIPGVYMHNGTLNTNRITIRGIGSRNLFGTSKIRAYYQDIPLTNGSGETTIEDIEMAGMSRMEILKGPSSSIYGAGLGGNIQIIPDKGLFNTYYIRSEYLIGSFGLQKFFVNTNLGNKTNSANLIYSNTHSNGYRENNELDRLTLSLSSNHYLNQNNNLEIVANFIDLKAYIPSSLDEENYINNPEAPAFTWGISKGYEDYSKWLLGTSWKHDYRSGARQITSIFSSFFDSFEARPFNILTQNTNALGLRTRFVNLNKVFQKELQWTIGFELFHDINSFKTFENLYQEYPPGTGSVQGNLLSNFKEKRTNINLFLEGKYSLSLKVILDFGLNINKTGYQLNDDFNKGLIDFSGDYSFDAIASPKIGLTYQLDQQSMIFGVISHGFSPPKLEETLLPDGLINTNIQPETGWNYEIGSRGKFLKNIFQYEVSIYLMNIENLLVARRTGDDQFIGVNAGKTNHFGVEVTINYLILNTNAVQLSHSNAFSFQDYKFSDFEDLENNYSGNDLTGVPDKTFNSQLYLDSNLGIYANLNYQYISAIPVNDINTVYADSYQLVNTKIGYQRMFGKKFQLNVYIGINNLFDEKYASMLQINAGSFGGNAPRYYYPGEPINSYSGMILKYTF